jgi:hypothetical protein
MSVLVNRVVDWDHVHSISTGFMAYLMTSPMKAHADAPPYARGFNGIVKMAHILIRSLCVRQTPGGIDQREVTTTQSGYAQHPPGRQCIHGGKECADHESTQ